MVDGLVNTKATDEMRIEKVHISKIRANKFQPRKTSDVEKMEELKESVGSVGVIDPIMVRPINGGEYEIIKGHRRFDVLVSQGKKMITVLVKEGVDDNRSAMEAFISNECRSNLDPFERAAAIRSVQEIYGIKKLRDLAKLLGMNENTLGEALRYEQLSEPVKEMVRSGKIATFQASKIWDIPDFEAQKQLADIAAENGLDVSETLKIVKAVKKAPDIIKHAILEQQIDPRDAINILENDVPDEIAQTVVEELEERKSRRDAHNRIQKQADAETLSGRMTTSKFKRLKSDDEKAFDKITTWKDQFFIQPSTLLASIEDEGMRKEAIAALRYVIDKATEMLVRAQDGDVVLVSEGEWSR